MECVMVDPDIVAVIRRKYERLTPIMDERMRRHWAACEALALPRGGIATVTQATGLSRTTLWAGIREIEERDNLVLEDEELATDCCEGIRRPGGGRKPLTETDPGLLAALEALVEPTTRGDPQTPLLWTCKSTHNLAVELGNQGHAVCDRTVATLLYDLGYSLQANRKTKEGSSHADRNAQFEHISKQVKDFQRRGQPVVSIDSKKKELVGDFKNAGREWRPQGQPEEVRATDFKDKILGKVAPYGVYDLTCNQGWVSVGVDHDTAEFATATLSHWWQQMGKPLYPQAVDLLATADCGGSNAPRTRLWQVGLQRLANNTGLRISVCHFPPGTSKWNKIEHRMFCHITQNWRARPLVSRAVIVNLIGHTTTKPGLRIRAELDLATYPTKIKVSKAELATVRIVRDPFHGEWNYTISPNA
jgi:hypothetical protein